MEYRYIGIKPVGKGRFESTNMGVIFTRQEDGTYISSKDNSFILTENQIKHDLDRGYLEPASKINIEKRFLNNNTLGLTPSKIANLILNEK